MLLIVQSEVLKGHGFSRAEKPPFLFGALAPEGRLSYKRLSWRPGL